MTAVVYPTVSPPTLLWITGLTKRFGHIEALRGVDLDIRPGEIVGLVGDNGAGKSTVIKILSGDLQPDGGSLVMDGRALRLTSPRAARDLGIETVYQDLALAPDLDPVANLFLGRELYRLKGLGALDIPRMRARAQHLFDELGIRLPSISAPVFRLSGGQRQGIAIARAIAWSARLIIMDEPTAALGYEQSRHVLDLITEARARGASVVLISHNLPEICQVADRLHVLRLGRRVATLGKGVQTAELLGAMSGLERSEEAVPA